MARPLIPAISNDFDKVWQFFASNGVVPKASSAEMVTAAKKMHRATFSMILWRFRLKRLPEHSKCFIEEIASDALQILPQALMGYRKTVDLLIRSITENTLRHVYFSDHPIEFHRMNREAKWHLSTEELIRYPLMHPKFPNTTKDALSQMGTLYSDLSAGVHGRTVDHLEMRSALAAIQFEQMVFSRQTRFVEKCAATTNFVLAVFHHEAVTRFQLEDRRIILNSMPVASRKIWSNL